MFVLFFSLNGRLLFRNVGITAKYHYLLEPLTQKVHIINNYLSAAKLFLKKTNCCNEWAFQNFPILRNTQNCYFKPHGPTREIIPAWFHELVAHTAFKHEQHLCVKPLHIKVSTSTFINKQAEIQTSHNVSTESRGQLTSIELHHVHVQMRMNHRQCECDINIDII